MSTSLPPAPNTSRWGFTMPPPPSPQPPKQITFAAVGAWFMRLDASIRITLAITLTVAVFAVSLAVVNAINPQALQATTLTPTATTSTPSGPQPIGNVATLGGTPDGFQAAFGDPLPGLNDTYGVTLQGIALQVTVDFVKGQDNAPHAQTINISSATIGQRLIFNTTQALMPPFLPIDAQPHGTQLVQHVTEHDFISASLGVTLTMDYFIDDAGSTVTPGTMSWFCTPDQRGGFTFCTVTSGKH